MSPKVKAVRQILTICVQFVLNATGLWETTTRSTSFRLYRRGATLGTCGNVSSTQILHLLLRLRLEEHENKDHEWQAAELAEVRVLVSIPAMEWKRTVLYEHSRPIYDGSDDSKLDAHLEERPPLWLRLVQFWCKIVNKSGDQERKYEAKDANPRDSQSLDQFIFHLNSVKEKMRWKFGYKYPNPVPVTQSVRVSVLCRRFYPTR